MIKLKKLKRFRIGGEPPDWVSPTGFEDPDNAWGDEEEGYDENLETCASYSLEDCRNGAWSKFIVFTHSALTVDKIRYYWKSFSQRITEVDIDVYDGEWQDIFEGAVGNEEEWIEKEFSTLSNVTKMRLRFYNPDSTTDYPAACEHDFWGS